MAASQQLQLRAAIAALFASLAADGGVHQNRDLDLPTGKTALVNINVRSSQPSDDEIYSSAPRDWRTEFELVITTRRDGSTEASDAADALWTVAYAALMANQTLGGAAQQIDPGEMNVEDGQGDTSVCRLTWIFYVVHRTANNTIT